MKELEDWLVNNGITEVECLVPDLAGIARGKILPATKFLNSLGEGGMRLPESMFAQTVTGDFADAAVINAVEPDIFLRADPSSVRIVPWYDEPTASVIMDCYMPDGGPVAEAPRHVLRRVLECYREQGWRPVVAPEIEFYLVEINEDPDYPLEPPIGRSGRRDTNRQSYGIDAANEFDPVFEDVYDYCDAQGIGIDTLSREGGPAQMEVNFNHGDPLQLADEAFLFKRTLREAALRHKVWATFMAKPMENEPGSSMHIHQSVVDLETGQNVFATRRGANTRLFLSHMGGLQKHLPFAMALVASNVNSYRRLRRHSDAPINTHWAPENRTVGFRVPHSEPSARRVENRVVGADANPYLAIAASLACGLLGMTQNLKPTKPIEGSAYRLAHSLPRSLPESLDRLRTHKPLRDILGERFVDIFVAVKREEYDQYQQVISSWEREFLLLNV